MMTKITTATPTPCTLVIGHARPAPPAPVACPECGGALFIDTQAVCHVETFIQRKEGGRAEMVGHRARVAACSACEWAREF